MRRPTSLSVCSFTPPPGPLPEAERGRERFLLPLPASGRGLGGGVRRRGVSLLESLISVAILFISVISINQLLDTAGEQAERVPRRSLAAQLCQSKMAEVVAGAAPLSSGSGEVEELPGWQWTVEAEEHDVSGLWRVRVSVRRGNEDAAVSLDQLVLDPS